MATTQYIGARYVPLFAEPIEWDKNKQYEPLTIVTHNGNSYTSRQFVPTGIEITNEAFWALTSNYNAQIEQYRKEVAEYDGRITTAQNTADAANTAAGNAAAAVAAEKTRAEAKESDIQSLSETNKNKISNLDAQMAATTDSELLNKITNETNRAIEKENEIASNLSNKTAYVTPEQFGAIGDGIADDTEALQNAINSKKYVIGVGCYHCNDTIRIANSHQRITLKSIVSDANDYALSVMNGSFGQELVINELTAAHNGVIAVTNKITGRHCMHFGVIDAKGGIAFNMTGGDGGVLDCKLSGQVWTGTTSGLTVAPSKSFIGNITFDSIRFTASSESATALTLDTSNGSITQLHFPNCSVEPESVNAANNGILINVVNNIQFCDGYFRTTELTGKTGYILKIAGNVTNQLSQGLHFTFDHIVPSKIDLSELNMSRYYSLDSPICIIDCNKIVFASQPQSIRMVIKGNKMHCKPIRNNYVLASGDYNWDYTKRISNAIEFNANGTLNIPEWFDPDEDELMLNCASHSVAIKIEEYGTTETIKTLSDTTWVKLSFYRDNNLKLYAVKN